MADQDEDRSSDDLSEEPSQFKIEEFRKKGQVSQSRELSGVISLLAAGSALFLMAPKFSDSIFALMHEFFHVQGALKLNLTDTKILSMLLSKSVKVIAEIVLPIAGVGLVAGVLASFAQIGSIFSTDPITPDFKKINPLQGVKRLFSMKQLWNALRLVLKTSVVLAVAYSIVKDQVVSSPQVLWEEPAQILKIFSQNGMHIFYAILGVLAVFAVFDYVLERWEFGKKVRLTKQEAKQEHKEKEGDPLIRSRIRAIQRDMARKRMMDAVKTADAIITNPTHYAVAIRYDREKMDAPKVVAKGVDFLALRIREVARKSSVPLVENKVLARTLYRNVKIGQNIPRNLYQAVAEVLAYVYRLKNKVF